MKIIYLLLVLFAFNTNATDSGEKQNLYNTKDPASGVHHNYLPAIISGPLHLPAENPFTMALLERVNNEVDALGTNTDKFGTSYNTALALHQLRIIQERNNYYLKLCRYSSELKKWYDNKLKISEAINLYDMALTAIRSYEDALDVGFEELGRIAKEISLYTALVELCVPNLSLCSGKILLPRFMRLIGKRLKLLYLRNDNARKQFGSHIACNAVYRELFGHNRDNILTLLMYLENIVNKSEMCLTALQSIAILGLW